MNENFKKLLAETMKDIGNQNMEAQVKVAAEQTYILYKSFRDAGFNEMQAMSIILEVIGGAIRS